MRYSDQELLNEIHNVADELGHSPSLTEFRELGEYSVSVYYSRFGSWNKAIKRAGHDPNEPDSKISRKELLEELHRLADSIGKVPTASDMDEQGKYWASTYQNEFDSWNEALEVADFEPKNTGTTVADEELIEEIERLAEKIGEPPRFQDMQELGNYDPATYNRRFESWNDALETAGFKSNTQGSLISKEELLNEIVRLSNELGSSPSAREMDKKGRYSSATYQRRFESWSNAVETAIERYEDCSVE